MTPLSSEILESIVENQRLLVSQQDEHDLGEKGTDQDWEPNQRLQQIRTKLPPLLGIVACTVAALFLIAIAANIGIRKLSSNDQLILDCGKSPAEAKAKGCIFDIMNYAWTPPACYEEDLVEEALRMGPWPWYLDQNATQEIPQDPAILGDELLVWTT